MSMFHRDAPSGDIHQIHQWTYADATARAAATGFVSSDVGKVALQTDTSAYYILTNYSPITWQKIGDGTAGSLSGTLGISQGGTGQTTQQAAINALTGTQGAGKYLRSDGTNAALSTIQASDVPTLNQNTTGTAANVTGTVAIANGGTGQTTKAAAFDALSPNTTKGDLTVFNGTNNVRLPVGADTYVLTVDSTQASGVKWAAVTASQNVPVASKSAAYTMTSSDGLILASASSAAFTVTLPAASGNTGMTVRVKKTDSSTNAVTISRAGTDTIDGATTYVISTQYQSVVLISDGSSSWNVV